MSVFAGRPVFRQAFSDSFGNGRGSLAISIYKRLTYTDGVTTSGSKRFTSATAAFASADAGKVIAAQNFPSGVTIETYVSPTEVDLSAPATATGTGRSFQIAGRQRSADLATIYSDRLKSVALAQPYIADAAGNVLPFLDPGDYDAVTIHGVEPFTVLPDHEDVEGAVSGLPAHLADTIDAHDASAISVVPAGSLAATTVQAALAELDNPATLVGNDATDNRSLLATAEAAKDNIAVPPGTYRINSDITLTKSYRFRRGAILKPAAGVTVTFNGAQIDAGRYKIFDTSLAATTTVSGAQTLPTPTTSIPVPTYTLTVASTTGFPAAGTIRVQNQVVLYTGKTATTFTGCTGGLGAIANGAAVVQSRQFLFAAVESPKVFPEWWGVGGLSIQEAINSLPEDGSGLVECAGGTYDLTVSLYQRGQPTGLHIKGVGEIPSVLRQTTATESVLTLNGFNTDTWLENVQLQGGTNQLHFTGGQAVRPKLEHIRFNGGTRQIKLASTCLGIIGSRAAYCNFFGNLGDSIDIDDSPVNYGLWNNADWDNCWWQSANYRTYLNAPLTSGGHLDDWTFTRCTWQGPHNTNSVATMVLGVINNLVFINPHFADFEFVTGQGAIPIIKAVGGANGAPNRLTMLNPDITNNNGSFVLVPGPAGHTTGRYWTFIGGNIITNVLLFDHQAGSKISEILFEQMTLTELAGGPYWGGAVVTALRSSRNAVVMGTPDNEDTTSGVLHARWKGSGTSEVAIKNIAGLGNAAYLFTEKLTGSEGATGVIEMRSTVGNSNYSGLHLEASDARLRSTTPTGPAGTVLLGRNGRPLLAATNSVPADADLENSQLVFYLDQATNALKVKAKYSDGIVKTATIGTLA